MTSALNDKNSGAEVLTPMEAAHYLGVTAELVFQYTKSSFARACGLSRLASIEVSGATRFSKLELDRFNNMLAGPWPEAGKDRPAIPKAILDHLRAESLNQCSRCGNGLGVETAHIRSWAESRSHHHDNLIRLCVSCHKEHDAHHCLPTDVLLALKTSLVERTRANLRARMSPSAGLDQLPSGTNNFVGRTEDLVRLGDGLRSVRTIAVIGVGGIGKTQLLIKALSALETRRTVLWVDVGRYAGALDILGTLQSVVGHAGLACPRELLAERLDQLQACIVFDGVEQSTLDDIDDFEDAVAELVQRTATCQFVLTSQISLYKLEIDFQVNLGKLDDQSSRLLLERVVADPMLTKREDARALLDFCEGHALTLRIAGALLKHFQDAGAILKSIKQKGAGAVILPGRRRQDRGTSLQLCMLTAYQALSMEARKLLAALGECPAGLHTHWIDGDWLKLIDPVGVLAELRQWHLVDTIPLDGGLSRTLVLSPVRAFTTSVARENDLDAHRALSRDLVHGLAMLVAVLETKYDDPEDTPYVLARFREELPNLLHTLALAREFRDDSKLALTSVSIARSLMRYFFVCGLAEQGATTMRDAAELAFLLGETEAASALVLQFTALAQRTNKPSLMQEALDLINRVDSLASEEIKADLAMGRAMVAKEQQDNEGAAAFARAAIAGYRRRLASAPARRDQDRDTDVVEFATEASNDLSGAYGLLGFALLASADYSKAAEAYKACLRYQRGASIAVNRGQTLHQLGNCYSHLQEYKLGADHYLNAAMIFHFVGMEEFLSNALGELGYAYLDVEVEFQTDLNRELLIKGLDDLKRDMNAVFDKSTALDHSRCISILRKFSGSIMLCSLIGQGSLLGSFCSEIEKEIINPFGQQFAEGQRDRDEMFPIMAMQVSARLGMLVAISEVELPKVGDISRDVVEEILITVCEAHEWAQDQMRLIDWLSAFLTRRWDLDGASRERVREFVQNYRDDVVDYLDLSRKQPT